MADQECPGVDGFPCSNAATFTVWRIHDGGGKRVACGLHLSVIVRKVNASIPDWATNPTAGVYVKEV